MARRSTSKEPTILAVAGAVAEAPLPPPPLEGRAVDVAVGSAGASGTPEKADGAGPAEVDMSRTNSSSRADALLGDVPRSSDASACTTESLEVAVAATAVVTARLSPIAVVAAGPAGETASSCAADGASGTDAMECGDIEGVEVEVVATGEVASPGSLRPLELLKTVISVSTEAGDEAVPAVTRAIRACVVGWSEICNPLKRSDA